MRKRPWGRSPPVPPTPNAPPPVSLPSRTGGPAGTRPGGSPTRNGAARGSAISAPFARNSLSWCRTLLSFLPGVGAGSLSGGRVSCLALGLVPSSWLPPEGLRDTWALTIFCLPSGFVPSAADSLRADREPAYAVRNPGASGSSEPFPVCCCAETDRPLVRHHAAAQEGEI